MILLAFPKLQKSAIPTTIGMKFDMNVDQVKNVTMLPRTNEVCFAGRSKTIGDWPLTFVCLFLGLQATVPSSFIRQACFAIDYDFSTHKCFFFGVNVVVSQVSPSPIINYLHCPVSATVLPSSLGTRPNPNVVHITFCKSYEYSDDLTVTSLIWEYRVKSVWPLNLGNGDGLIVWLPTFCFGITGHRNTRHFKVYPRKPAKTANMGACVYFVSRWPAGDETPFYSMNIISREFTQLLAT